MDLSKISLGVNPPWDLNVVIEIPCGGHPVKYEIDKETGAILVDRFLHTAMYYPANYGFVPHTLADDGDPLDAMVIGDVPVIPGAIIRARPIGALLMEDEKGRDEKILMVPVEELSRYYSNIHSYTDLPQLLQDQIAHFFTHYKDLEEGKWVKVIRWADKEEAIKLIEQACRKGKAPSAS